MAKKNYLKELPRLGGAAVLTMAMAAALTTPVSASEIEEIPVDAAPAVEAAPVVEAASAPAAAPAVEAAPAAEAAPAPAAVTIVEPAQVAAVNVEIAESNTETSAENTGADQSNRSVDAGNEATVERNETATQGDLPAPQLPQLPEAPEAPEVPATDNLPTEEKNDLVDAYNGDVSDYNDQVDNYNDAADDYNNQVDEYNGAADAYNRQEQERYDQETLNYNDYLVQQQIYEEDQQNYASELERLEAEHNAAQSQAEAEHNAAQDKAEAEHNAAQDKAEAEHNAAQDKAAAEQEAAEKAAYEAAKAEAEAAHNAAETQNAADHLSDQLADYNAAKTEAEAAHQAAEAEREAAHNAAEAEREAEYNAAKTEAEAAHSATEAQNAADQLASELAEYNAAKTEAEGIHNAAEAEREAAHIAAEAERKAEYESEKTAAQLEYEAEKKAYEEAVATEIQIYDQVTEYNKDILEDNADITQQNQELEDALDSKAVESIDEVGEINTGVNVDAAILETLNTHDQLAAQEQELLDRGAALDTDARKDAALGSEAYASYLEEVKQYNADVQAHNEAVTAYNDAVSAYNEAVDHYNATKPNEPGNSFTGDGTTQTTTTTDWGNIDIDNHTLGHVDVKYRAAASKDVNVDAEGKKTYTDAVTQYEVTGVYTSESAAKEGQSEDYGLNYDNDGSGQQTGGTQELNKDEHYDEFGSNHGWGHNSSVALDPDSATVSFYVTLEDGSGQIHGLNVNLNADSVYAKGSYYKAQANDFLSKFYTLNEKGEKVGLPTEEIDGEEYYDISGQSVFLISALTCDGMTEGGYYTGFGWNQQFVSDGTLRPDGLDLILNLQTMIEIHQSGNADKISYLSYGLGKTAQAEKVEHKTYEELEGEFEYPDFVPNDFVPNKFEYPDFVPTEYEGTEFTYPDFVPQDFVPNDFEYPDFVPTEYEGTDFTYPDFVPTEYNRTEFQRTPYERIPFVPEYFVVPHYEGEPSPQEVAPPTDPVTVQHLEHVQKLDKLEDLLYFVEETPGGCKPAIDEKDPVSVKPLSNVTYEKPALANVPKTGDLSGIWAAISALALGGAALLNRKRKEEA